MTRSNSRSNAIHSPKSSARKRAVSFQPRSTPGRRSASNTAGFVLPTRPPRKQQAPVRRQKARKGKPKPATDLVSNALTQRLSEQLTAAAAKAIAKQPAEIVLAALLAGFASGETVRVEERGLSSVQTRQMGRSASFESVFETQRKKTLREQHVALAQVAAAALDFQVQRSDDLPLKNKGVAALCSAIDGKAINAAIRESFDAADYFGAVGRSMIARIVTEAMGADHARKVAAMKKPEATKFAIANVTKTGWLPMQLRTSHYDGPAAKAKKAPKAKANKKRK
jgi:ParB family chromosome partitioning protein